MNPVETPACAFSIDEILRKMVTMKASDLHLAVGSPPNIRIDGKLVPLTDYGTISNEMLKSALYSIISDDQKMTFEKNKELDFHTAYRRSHDQGEHALSAKYSRRVFRSILQIPLQSKS
jgi:Tfp pilus assembly pilus retraction ATPase PilT